MPFRPPRGVPTRTPAAATPGVLDRMLAELGAGWRLAGIAGDEIAAVLEQLWGSGRLRPGTAPAPR